MDKKGPQPLVTIEQVDRRNVGSCLWCEYDAQPAKVWNIQFQWTGAGGGYSFRACEKHIAQFIYELQWRKPLTGTGADSGA